MTVLLEKALKKVQTLPKDDQDAIASQILDSLSDDEAWRTRFTANASRLQELTREALEENERGETRPLEELL